MSSTSRISGAGIAGRGSWAAGKFRGALSPKVRWSQSFNDTPAPRAAASARSRTEGSMPSLLHDTREFMVPSGSDPALHLAPPVSPARPEQKTIEYRAGRLSLALDFFVLR